MKETENQENDALIPSKRKKFMETERILIDSQNENVKYKIINLFVYLHTNRGGKMLKYPN